MKTPVAVIIITWNEEANVAACLASVGWAAEVFVVDSGSEDRTVEIARSLGARVCEHPFEGYAGQRNWALQNLPLSQEWVLMLDADERIPPALAAEIDAAIRDRGQDYNGFYLKFRNIFFGRFLRHGGLYPIWLLRLYRRHLARFQNRPMNERVILDGKAGYLTEPFEHRDLRPLRDWVSKHNRYAELEADEYFQEKFRGGYGDALAARFWGTQAERKLWIKLRVWNRLPVLLRPFLFFFRNYIGKAGFLDGQAGFIYHVLWSFWYPFLVGVKIVERRAGAKEVVPDTRAALAVGRNQTGL
jgi:glycosyltransferase involved in cell wall biosynthesis